MANFDVISKCAKTVKSCFIAFSVNERNPEYVFNYLNRFYGTATGQSAKNKFDLLIIGGGSGGLSCAKEAAALKASVCVVDYVTPSPRGTTWGMGGTCVNVGCVPKKLMHHAALLGEAVHEAYSYGWDIKDLDKVTFNWERLKSAVQNHIKSVNWVLRVEMKSSKIEYVNGFARFMDEHTIEVKVKDTTRRIQGDNIVIATGGRPKYPDIPGAVEYGVTSDDIFSLSKPPGKTLIVGGGYVALETAGFLNSFNSPVTVMFRSVILRNFDRQMADLIFDNMSQKGVNFIQKTAPIKINKVGDKLYVDFKHTETNETKTEEFDTVLFAIGRRPCTYQLNLEGVKINVDKKTEKVITDNERTNVPHIYAVGDVNHGKPELSPVAIEAGKRLARRIFGKSQEYMNYDNVATTVFSPLEYGCVGLSEETAVERFGKDNLEVYHSYFKPLEFWIPEKSTSQCYLKVITQRKDPQKVLGMHYLGPLAGEVIQGYAAAFQSDFTMEHLKKTVGIHPTASEEFTRLSITKRSGLDPKPPSCCS